MDVKAKAENLLSVGKQLCKILEQENLAITRRAYQLIQSSLDAKDRLSRAYEKLTQALVDPPGQFEQLPEERRGEIKEMVRELEQRTEENTRQLKVQIEAHECVIKHVAAAAKDASNSTASYNQYGTCAPKTRAGTPATKTVTYDQVF